MSKEENRAAAIGMAHGPEAGLAALDAVDARALAGYHLLPATRADFLRRLGRRAEAAAPSSRRGSPSARTRTSDPSSVLLHYADRSAVTGRSPMTVRRFIVAALAIATLGTAAARPALAQTTLTMSSWVSPQHHLTSNVLQGWANEVEKATGGRVKFQMLPKHPSAPPGTFDAVRDGLVDLSYVTASYTPARHVLPLMPELPGGGDTSLVNSVAYSRIYWKHFHKVGEYKGVKLLGVFTHGPGQMFTKKPVTGIADVQGLKIRTGGGVAEAVAKALGASAFVKPAPESYELLKSGVADGVFFPMESIVSFKLDTVLEQATLFPGGMYSSAFGFFMNEDKWNKLPKQDQEAIEKISGEHIARLAGHSWDEADKRGFEVLKKSGVKIVNASPEFVAEVRRRSAPIVEDWIKQASAKGVDAAKILAEFREELKKVAAGK
jgi:TRAP-type C4-dicarboxylate transport system substrate-binding protein